MLFQKLASEVSTQIEGLGKLDGFKYANSVKQFCGIPYATLPNGWTRSTLKTSWEDGYHDGTQLGNMCPQPQVRVASRKLVDLVFSIECILGYIIDRSTLESANQAGHQRMPYVPDNGRYMTYSQSPNSQPTRNLP